MRIDNSPGDDEVKLYDWHSPALPQLTDSGAKIMIATSYARQSIATAENLLRICKPNGLLLIESDCTINEQFIWHRLVMHPTSIYLDSPRRRMDWVHNERISFRGIERDFIAALSTFLMGIADVPKQNIKRVFEFVRKGA